MKPILKGIAALLPILAAASAPSACPRTAAAQAVPAPPPSTGGFFPLSEVHRGLKATAWTVFAGVTPEPMDVEILGVLHGARGPGHDMIMAVLKGPKAEFTGVVAGMSGSPVYVGTRLLGSVSYRFGQFSKEAIAGITPIAQMLEVRDLPLAGTEPSTAPSLPNRRNEPTAASWSVPYPADNRSQPASASAAGTGVSGGTESPLPGPLSFQPIETPLATSGFHPEAMRFWQQQVAGTGLEGAAAAGGGSEDTAAVQSSPLADETVRSEPSAAVHAAVLPGSAVSMQLIRGDLELAATCTVTYVDPKQILACGHPVLQAGAVSLPMTTAEVVVTLASPFSPFKIVNTGETIGAFTEDRDAAIRGVLGARARMIPLHIAVHSPSAVVRELHIEILDLPALTPQALMVSLYESLLQSNDAVSEASYHVTGSIDLGASGRSPIDLWALASDQVPAPIQAALLTGLGFGRIYQNETRMERVRSIDLRVEQIPKRVTLELESARLTSGDIVHAGDTIVVEATLQPWHSPARNLRIPVKIPDRLQPGNIRLLVSDAGTLDRTLDQPRLATHSMDLDAVLNEARSKHAADRLYVSFLLPEAQAGVGGSTLPSLPLSIANALEPMRSAEDVSLSGESARVSAAVPVDGVASGFQILNLHIEAGGGLN